MGDQLNQLVIIAVFDPLPPLGWRLPIGFLDEIDLAFDWRKEVVLERFS